MSFTEGTDSGGPVPGLLAEPMPGEPEPPTSRSALFGNIEAKDLRLSTAIEVAFRALPKPAFIGPILVISVIINAVIEVTVMPILARSMSLSPTGQPTIEDVSALLGAAAISFAVSLIGGVLVSLYGQIWAVAASVGPFPTVGETMRLVGRRWVGVLGASLLVTGITLAAVIGGVAVIAILAQVSDAIAFGGAMALVVAFVWFIARLSMTPWLAADGLGVVASVQGSWRITEGNLLRIIGWSFVYGLLFALLAAAIGAVLGGVPLVGAGIAQGISLALTYAAGVTLFRRTQASAAPPAIEPTAPPVSETSIG